LVDATVAWLVDSMGIAMAAKLVANSVGAMVEK